MKFLVAEMFYSQQSEGISTGFPAFFLRLAKCNLCCGGVDGKLIKEGKATWYCDTIPVWSKGTEKTFQEIYDVFQQNNIFDWLCEGRVHLIISGGEPTMPQHQEAIIQFIKWFDEKHPDNKLYIEIETNGTYVLAPELFNRINQINCSPKLSNSGMSALKRNVPVAILQLKNHRNVQFKFVITSETDLIEVQTTYVEPLSIPWQKIVLMPGVDCLDNLPEMTRKIFELGKKYGYRAITRSHVLAWNKCTGV